MSAYDGKPIAFNTEADARAYAYEVLAHADLSIVHSPHTNNRGGNYFIDAPCPLVRSWESIVFEGKGEGGDEMKRRGYREGVALIALNDEPLIMDAEHMGGFASVMLLAHLFGKEQAEVARDVVRYREKHQDELRA